jgi:mannose-6-phosphate isomerase-like protein (cupin superfamily)
MAGKLPLRLGEAGQPPFISPAFGLGVPPMQSIKPILIEAPTRITAAGNKPKQIEEYIGRVNSGHAALSIARMQSPEGWVDPGQRPTFDEYSVVLRGVLRVAFESGELEVRAGQAVLVPAGTWVRYSTPVEGGSEYIAVCIPAFSPESVHRDNDR